GRCSVAVHCPIDRVDSTPGQFFQTERPGDVSFCRCVELERVRHLLARNETRQIRSRHFNVPTLACLFDPAKGEMFSLLASVAPSSPARSWTFRPRPPRCALVAKRRKIPPWFHGGSTPFWLRFLQDRFHCNLLILLVPLAGLEPARCCHHLILSQARLPIPPQ